jgi:hypothetical protein
MPLSPVPKRTLRGYERMYVWLWGGQQVDEWMCRIPGARGRRAGTGGHPPVGVMDHRTIRAVMRTGEQGAR